MEETQRIRHVPFDPGQVWTRTGVLRVLRPPGEAGKLQEKWISGVGRVEWRDVPVVTSPDEPEWNTGVTHADP